MLPKKLKPIIAFGLSYGPWNSRSLGPPKRSLEQIPANEKGAQQIRQIEPQPLTPVAISSLGFGSELCARFTQEANLPVPPLYFGRFYDARYFQPTFALIDSRDRLVRAFSQGWEPSARLGNYAFEQIRLGRPHKLKGSSLLIDVRTHSQNYFHWLHEAAPRLSIAASVGMEPKQFDHILVSNPGKTFHEETWKLWNIAPERVVNTATYPHIECEELCAVSDTWMFPYEAVLRGTRVFDPAQPTNSSERRILIDRRDTTARQLINSDALHDALKPLGFERISISGLSIGEQAKLFSSAKCIVAVHGAALANLAFCRANTVVLELHHPRYLLGLYWRLSHRLGLRYAAIVGRDASPDISDSRNAHLSVDPNAVALLASQLLSST